jgi:hypothetical protein
MMLEISDWAAIMGVVLICLSPIYVFMTRMEGSILKLETYVQQLEKRHAECRYCSGEHDDERIRDLRAEILRMSIEEKKIKGVK